MYRSNANLNDFGAEHQSPLNDGARRLVFYQQNQSEAILKRFHDIIQTENQQLRRQQSSRLASLNQHIKSDLKQAQLAKLSIDEKNGSKNTPLPNSHSALDQFTKTMTAEEKQRLNSIGPNYFGTNNEKPFEKMSALDKFTRLPQTLK